MKKWVKIVGWSFFGIGVLTLLSMVRNAQDMEIVRKPIIRITVAGEHNLLTQKELYTRLLRSNLFGDNIKWADLKVVEIEKALLQMPEIKEAHVFTNVGRDWTIDVTLRKPIARIYNLQGESYYLDAEGKIMPVINNCARVVVVNGHIRDSKNSVSVSEIINNDSLISIRKIDDVYRISNYVCNDPLMQAQIAQIHLLKNGEFVLIPMVGGQKIVFGTANSDEEVKEKFEKLKIFYKEAIPYEGWNKYDEINLNFKDQIVCRKKE